MKQKMTRFLNHENLENQLILLRKNHMISSNLPTKIREEPKNICLYSGAWKHWPYALNGIQAQFCPLGRGRI
jgi:hypothetical protein